MDYYHVYSPQSFAVHYVKLFLNYADIRRVFKFVYLLTRSVMQLLRDNSAS